MQTKDQTVQKNMVSETPVFVEGDSVCNFGSWGNLCMLADWTQARTKPKVNPRKRPAIFCEFSVREVNGYYSDSGVWYPPVQLPLFRLGDCVHFDFPALPLQRDAGCPSLTVLKVIHQGRRHSQSDPRRALGIGDRSLKSPPVEPPPLWYARLN